jgi:hypothetical protein
VAHTRGDDPYKDFAGLRTLNVDFFDGKRLSSLPGNGGARLHGEFPRTKQVEPALGRGNCRF